MINSSAAKILGSRDALCYGFPNVRYFMSNLPDKVIFSTLALGNSIPPNHDRILKCHTSLAARAENITLHLSVISSVRAENESSLFFSWQLWTRDLCCGLNIARWTSWDYFGGCCSQLFYRYQDWSVRSLRPCKKKSGVKMILPHSSAWELKV